MTITKVIPKAGRSYTVNYNGAQDVSTKYQVTLDEPLDTFEVPTSFPGIPAIGAAHPNRRGYYVQTYEVSQPDGASKCTLNITVKYGVFEATAADPSHPEDITYVTDWGWDDGTGEVDLVADVVDDTPVLNSAGDPFDSTVSRSVPMPTFTKVIRSAKRQSYAQYLCKVNETQITVGDMVCAPGTLLCVVSERKLIGEEQFPYQYTIRLKYRTNKLLLNSDDADKTEIGWDVAILDAGMREKIDGVLQYIQIPTGEGNQLATVTAPAPLDGHGAWIGHSTGEADTTHLLRFKAYERATFPEWFYSEPPTPAPDPDEED